MNLQVFVITHKVADIPEMDGYYPLLVGADAHPEIDVYERKDNTGCQISSKNKHYCELTGYYWIWKNVDAEAVGICHYRRFFVSSRFAVSPRHYLKKEEMEQMLQDHDVIVPCRHYYTRSIQDSADIAPNESDMKELEKAIHVVSPEYDDAFRSFLQNDETYFYNMLVMRKEQFDAYCSWLFRLLFYIEKDYEIPEEDAYRTRLFGFLSERLLYVWIHRNILPSRIQECRVIRTDESMLQAKRHEMRNGMNRCFWMMAHRKK